MGSLMGLGFRVSALPPGKGMRVRSFLKCNISQYMGDQKPWKPSTFLGYKTILSLTCLKSIKSGTQVWLFVMRGLPHCHP